MDIEKVKARIAKLLAMAADTSSPNEAAIAASRARKLLDKHNLDEGQVEVGDDFSAITTSAERRTTIPRWEQWLSTAVAEYNTCISRLVDGRLCMCGIKEDAELAASMFDYLREAVLRMCKAHMADQGYKRYNARVGNSFKLGATTELVAKLRILKESRENEVRDTGTGLICLREEAVHTHYGFAGYTRNSRKVPVDKTSYDQGKDDATDIEVNGQLADGTPGA